MPVGTQPRVEFLIRMQSFGSRKATDLERLRDAPQSTDAELAALAKGTEGTRTFLLMDVFPSPDESVGHKVEVKGIWMNKPDERINVSAIQATPARCEN